MSIVSDDAVRRNRIQRPGTPGRIPDRTQRVRCGINDSNSKERVMEETGISWQAAVSYSHNFATAKPDIKKTEKEHVLGLCRILEIVGKERDELRVKMSTTRSAG